MDFSYQKSSASVEQNEAGTTMGTLPNAEELAGASELLELNNDQVVELWCRRYGVTRDQLGLAASMVGRMPAALHYYLSSRGRATKVVTDEMRAARGPIRSRDRRRKHRVPVPDAHDVQAAELVRLREERSAIEVEVHTASVELHQHPCPSTIRAYDSAQTRLTEITVRLDAAERAAVANRTAAV